jgi:hypothetical protein
MVRRRHQRRHQPAVSLHCQQQQSGGGARGKAHPRCHLSPHARRRELVPPVGSPRPPLPLPFASPAAVPKRHRSGLPACSSLPPCVLPACCPHSVVLSPCLSAPWSISSQEAPLASPPKPTHPPSRSDRHPHLRRLRAGLAWTGPAPQDEDERRSKRSHRPQARVSACTAANRDNRGHASPLRLQQASRETARTHWRCHKKGAVRDHEQGASGSRQAEAGD